MKNSESKKENMKWWGKMNGMKKRLWEWEWRMKIEKIVIDEIRNMRNKRIWIIFTHEFHVLFKWWFVEFWDFVIKVWYYYYNDLNSSDAI